MLIEWSSFFEIYLFVFLALILFLWLLSWGQRRRAARDARPFFVCRICHTKKDIEPTSRWARCPHCGAANRLDA